MFDSTEGTLEHIDNVQKFLRDVVENIKERYFKHDMSKLEEPEKSVYDEYTPKLRELTYGSEEYWEALRGMGKALDHHYANNSHHPEHYKRWQCPLCESVFNENEAPIGITDVRLCPKCSEHGAIYESALEPASGIYGMSLLDLLEMLADWKAAGLRHKDSSMAKSIEINRDRFNMSAQLVSILENTVKEMGWE